MFKNLFNTGIMSSENDMIHMPFIDNTFVMVAGRVFQQTVGSPIGTKCVPPLNDFFLYSFEADFRSSPPKEDSQVL